ncbi:MAG: hypothetical protein ACLUI3_09880 [Christensenellales bacterium]
MTLARLADHPITVSLRNIIQRFLFRPLLRHDLPFSPEMGGRDHHQVLPAVRCNLGIGFVPHEMLVAVPELTGVYPLTLDDDRTAQHLSVPAKKSAVEHRCQHPRQMPLDTFCARHVPCADK